MNTIEGYLKELETYIIDLGGEKDLVEEYAIHLHSEFEDFVNIMVELTEKDDKVEEMFVKQLEPPKVIAHSLTGIPLPEPFLFPGKLSLISEAWVWFQQTILSKTIGYFLFAVLIWVIPGIFLGILGIIPFGRYYMGLFYDILILSIFLIFIVYFNFEDSVKRTLIVIFISSITFGTGIILRALLWQTLYEYPSIGLINSLPQFFVIAIFLISELLIIGLGISILTLFYRKKFGNALSESYMNLEAFYHSKETPVLTATIFTLVLFTPIALIHFLHFLFTDQNFLYEIRFSDSDDLFNFFQSYLTPIELIVILLSIALMIGFLGWKYSTGYGFKTTAYISIFFTAFYALIGREFRLIGIDQRIASTGYGLTPDWYRASLPTLEEYLVDFLDNIVFHGFLLLFIGFVILMLIGSTINVLWKENFQISSALKNRLPVLNSSLVLVAILFAILLPSFHLSDLTSKSQISNPGPEDFPLIYSFDIRPRISQYAIGYNKTEAELVRTVLPVFGNLGFILFEYFMLKALDVGSEEDRPLSLTGEFSPLPKELGYDDYDSIGSQTRTTLLGTFYLPDRFNTQSWQDFIGNEINSSFPFNGFTPEPDLTITSIDWIINGKTSKLQVNTIKYLSTTNDSVFTISFDKTTGWLMEAHLIRESGSWAQGLSFWVNGTEIKDFYPLETLEITRVFLKTPVEDPSPYYSLDTILLVWTFGMVGLILGISVVFYYKKKKLN